MITQTFSAPTQEMSIALRAQLAQFGLNPQEWATYPLKGGTYCAIHRQDQELVLIGEVVFHGTQPCWQDLCLLEDQAYGVDCLGF